MRKSSVLAALGLGLLATSALAQSPDAPLRGRDTDPALPPASQTPPDRVRPDDGSGGNLREKLEKNDGVIKPPSNAAPGMVVTPPDPNPGSMPVIKPSELPGREPGTEAK